MIWIRLKNAGSIRCVMLGLEALLDDATFEFSANGLKVFDTDKHKACAISLVLEVTAFEEYMCTEATCLVVKVSEVLDLLRESNPSGEFWILIVGNNALVHFEQASVHYAVEFSYSFGFGIPCDRIINVQSPIVSFEMSILDYEEMVVRLDALGKWADLVCTRKKVIIYATGRPRKARYEVKTENDIEDDSVLKFMFNTRYLLYFAVYDLDGTVKIEITKNRLLIISYAIQCGENRDIEVGTLTYYLPPLEPEVD